MDSASEYYPPVGGHGPDFGQLLTDGNYSSGSYRFGFQGQEMDNEIKGTGNSYTTLFRQYDPRLGRWMSLDPAMAKYPGQSPYVAFNNNPVFYTDPSGDDPPEDDTHNVQSGESVWAIAKDRLGNNATNAEIAELTNNIIKWDGLNEDGDISPGQELTVVNPDNQDYVWSSGADSEPTVEPVTTEHTQITPEFDNFSENSSEGSEMIGIISLDTSASLAVLGPGLSANGSGNYILPGSNNFYAGTFFLQGSVNATASTGGASASVEGGFARVENTDPWVHPAVSVSKAETNTYSGSLKVPLVNFGVSGSYTQSTANSPVKYWKATGGFSQGVPLIDMPASVSYSNSSLTVVGGMKIKTMTFIDSLDFARKNPQHPRSQGVIKRSKK